MIAGGYGALLAVTALWLAARRTDVLARRAPVAAVSCAAYALVAIGLATLDTFWVHLLAPGALLLGAYWLSGPFFRDPQIWLESWLLRSDRSTFETLRVDAWLRRAPRWMLELLEASYTADYIVVGGGAILTAPYGAEAVSRYWTIVLAAELTCYAALPFLRSRPPRALEPPGVIAERAPLLRALNTAILDRASVQANTLPSGHVAGAAAATLAIMPISPAAGLVFLAMTALIGISATVGRYHYAVDCALGAVVALAAWAITG